MKKIIKLICCLCAPALLSANLISLTVTGVQALKLNNGSWAPNGNLVWVGTFQQGFDISANALNFNELSNNFGSINDSGDFVQGTPLLTTTTTDFGAGQDGSFNTTGDVSDANGTSPKLFVWAFNAPSAAQATEYGIVELPNLLNGVPPLGILQSLSMDVSVTATHVGSYSSNVLTLAAVPEPATYAALLGLVALVGVVFNRRR